VTLPIENNIYSKYTTAAKQCTYNEWEKLVDICSNALKGVRVEITKICQDLDTCNARQLCSKIDYKCDYFDFPIIYYRTFVNRRLLLACKITESRLPETVILSLKNQIQKCMVIIANCKQRFSSVHIGSMSVVR
jgi:hypothetical protein